jgi:hypothetical protein
LKIRILRSFLLNLSAHGGDQPSPTEFLLLPEIAAMTARRILLASALMLALAGSASARMSGPQTFKPAEGMIQDLGSKRAIGFFLKVGGACQMTLMIAGPVAADGASASSASMSFDMIPGQSVALGSADGETLVATCGAGAETIEVKRGATRS